jgi:hypothetical protein
VGIWPKFYAAELASDFQPKQIRALKDEESGVALTQEQIQQYHRDGFLLLPALIDAEALNRLNQRFLDIVDGAEPCSGAMKIMRDVMVVKGVVEPETPLHGVNKLFCLEDDSVLNTFSASPATSLISRPRWMASIHYIKTCAISACVPFPRLSLHGQPFCRPLVTTAAWP